MNALRGILIMFENTLKMSYLVSLEKFRICFLKEIGILKRFVISKIVENREILEI